MALSSIVAVVLPVAGSTVPLSSDTELRCQLTACTSVLVVSELSCPLIPQTAEYSSYWSLNRNGLTNVTEP